MTIQSTDKGFIGPPALRIAVLKPTQARNLLARYVLGHNTALDNANLQDLTNFGEDYITQPTTLTAMGVVSDSIEDDSGGTGAQQVTIHGLDENWNEKIQTVILNGETEVTTDDAAADIEFLKINHVNVSGTSPTNAQHTAVGNITLQTAGGGTTYGLIEAGGNMELACRATVPNGFTAYLIGWDASAGKVPAQGDEIVFFLRGTVDPVDRTVLTNVFIFQDIMHLASNSNFVSFDPPFKFPEKTEIKVSAQLNGSGTAAGSAAFRYYLVPNQN